MKRSTKFISIGLLISFAAACGGSNDESGRVKNAALTTLSKPAFTTTTKATTVLSPVTTTGVLSGTSPLTGEAGGTLDAKISLSWDKYARLAYTPTVVDPSKLSIAPEVLERLRAVGSQVQYMPVVVRLPVPYDPIKRATELSTQTKQISTDGLSERPKVGQIPVMTTDIAILDATRALSDFLDSMPDWQWLKRSVSVADLHKAADLFVGNPPKTAQAGDSQSKVVAAPAYVAQLGQTPFVRALLTAPEIEELAAKRLIVSASVDNYGVNDLDQSMPVIGSHEPTTFGNATGFGTSVAIFDTGVMATHPAFGSRVVRQRCYTSGSNCANGSTSDTSSNSAMPCTFSNRCDHGTHVAGIAAGAAVPTATLASPGADGSAVATGATSWHAGVAPRANILAYRLGSCCGSSGGATFFDSDFVLAAGDLSTVVTSRNVVSLNYSVGTTTTYSDDVCNRDADSSVAAFVDAIDTLQAQNVAVVIAAGNSSSTSNNSYPGCLVEPVSVSSTSIEDTIATYSNISATRTDLLAPGGDSTTAGGAIIAPSVSGSAVDTATYEAKNGTSMAAPTVAGAWALVRQITPSMNVESVLALLQDNGKSVTDARSGGTVTKKRIDLRSTLPLETSSGITNVVAKFSGNRKTMSQGASLLRGGTTTATKWTGTVKFPASPLFAPNTSEGAYLFFSTRDGLATSVTVNGTTYTTELAQSGYSATTCRAKSPMRSYRVALNASTLTSSNTVSIATSKTTVVDGVSMFLVSRQVAGLAVGGNVIITDGLGVMNAESGQMSAALTSPADLAGRPLSLHVAVADGQSAAESGILFKTSSSAAGTFVTPSNQFSGSDGLNWDDHTFDLSGKGLSGSPGLLVVSHTGVAATSTRDCLAFVAAMLNIGAQPLSTMLTPALTPTVVGSGPNSDRGIVRPTVTFAPVR